MRKLLVLLFLFVTSPVLAGWSYHSLENGYYIRTNDSGANDGWLYTYKCGRYYYAQPYQNSSINVNNSTSDIKITYSKTWKEDIVKAVDNENDRKAFQATLVGSGLVNPNGMNYQQSYGNINGISTYTQGLFGQGSTVYSAANFSRQPVDWQAYYNYAQNFQNRASDGVQAMNNGVNINTQLANEGDLELAKVQSVMNANIATLQSAVKSAQITQHYSTQSSVGVPPVPQPPQNNNNQFNIMSMTRGQVVLANNCAKCHSGENPEGKTAFVDTFINMTNTERRDLACNSLDRMSSNDPEFVMPPPKFQHEKLSAEDRIGVYDVLLKGTLN